MRAIWKYELVLSGDNQGCVIPEGAQFRFCAVQHGGITLWFEVDPSDVGDVRTFRIVGTGHREIDPAGMSYLGTVLMDDGYFVWHIYEVLPAPR